MDKVPSTGFQSAKFTNFKIVASKTAFAKNPRNFKDTSKLLRDFTNFK